MSSMRNVLFAFVVGVFITATPLSYLAIHLADQQNSKVLAEKVVKTPPPTPILTPSPSPSSTPTPKPTPTYIPTPAPTPIPAPSFSSEEVNGFIDRFAAQYAVDPNVLRYIATCESSFNPLAQNWGYAGLFQFGPTTWANLRKEIGEDPDPDLRFNAEEAAQTAAYALSQHETGIWPNCTP